MAEDKKKWRREFSAGGVVYKKSDGRVFVLMINPKSRDFGPPEKFWSFPKGHIAEGETTQDAAVRETKEETGIDAKVVQKISDIKYTFIWGEDNVFKIVTYFLMEYVSGEPKPDQEVEKVEWVEIDQALARLKFTGDKQIFKQANELINESASPRN